MSDQELIDVATARINAFNDRDWDAMREVSAPDLVYHDTATGRQPTNVEEMIALSKGWSTAFPDAQMKIDKMSVGGNTVIAELSMSGTHTGPFVIGEREIPATGKFSSVQGCLLFEIEDGKVTEIRTYTAMTLIMQQLGLTG